MSLITIRRCLIGFLAGALFALPWNVARGVTIGDLCRVKGQEENHLLGIGLVSGLSGTGDGNLEKTKQMLARQIQLLSDPRSQVGISPELIESLKTPNVALVLVTATVPGAGVQRGGRIDCVVSAPNAKSLDGGFLLPTHLTSTIPGDERVYAISSGKLTVEDPKKTAVATIEGGCQMEADFETPFVQDGKFTLILREPHAGFHVANEVEFEINQILDPNPAIGQSISGDGAARAIDSRRIVVPIPPQYLADHSEIEFIQDVLKRPFTSKPKERSRVVINERSGVITIDGDLEIGAVIVSHKNFRVSTGGDETAGDFVELDPSSNTSTTKLQALVDALKSLRAPNEDIIDIIKELNALGAIYGELVVR